SELAQKALRGQERAYEESANKRILEDRRQFQEKYEALGRAMEKFTMTYNAARGNVWPKKEAEALAKAIRELERTSNSIKKTRNSDGETMSCARKKNRRRTE